MTTATTAKTVSPKSTTAKDSTTAARTSRPASNKIEKDSILMALAKLFYGDEIAPSNTGSDIAKIEKGTDNDKTYIWYMTDSVSRVIELKALEESSKLKHLVGSERSVIYTINVGKTFYNEINLDEAEQLLEEFPDIPREKNLESYLSALDVRFKELNIDSIINSDDLNFGKDKLKRLGAVKISQWLDLVINELHVFHKREYFAELVVTPHKDLHDLYGKLKPLMRDFGLQDKHYGLSFKEMMIHKIGGFDFVVADLMPKLLKLEASLKEDEFKAEALKAKESSAPDISLNNNTVEKKVVSIYDKTVSRVLKGSVCAGVIYFGITSLYNFVNYF